MSIFSKKQEVDTDPECSKDCRYMFCPGYYPRSHTTQEHSGSDHDRDKTQSPPLPFYKHGQSGAVTKNVIKYITIWTVINALFCLLPILVLLDLGPGDKVKMACLLFFAFVMSQSLALSFSLAQMNCKESEGTWQPTIKLVSRDKSDSGIWKIFKGKPEDSDWLKPVV